MGESVGYPIGYVSLSTGLSTHTLRAWERRYQAVAPNRTDSGRRLYAQDDIERLLLLKNALEAGHRISAIAGLDATQLAELTNPPNRSPAPLQPEGDGAAGLQATIASGLSAIAAMDGDGLRAALQAVGLRLNRQTLLEAVISPLMAEVGRRWAQGRLRIVHGHLAARVIGAYLDRMLDAPGSIPAGCPRMVIAAPAGQWCDLGARAVAVTVRDHGWEPVLLGANLPCEEIAAACRVLQPQAVALSITCRIDDAYMREEFDRLAPLIHDGCSVLAGGRAAERYRADIEASGGAVCNSSEQFRALIQ